MPAGSEWHDEDLVFAQPNGRPIDEKSDYDDWSRLLQAVGVRHVRLHDGRHTAATRLLSENVHPRVVMELLGHSQMRTTMDIYSHVMPALAREAVDPMGALLLPGKGGQTATATATRSRTFAEVHSKPLSSIITLFRDNSGRRRTATDPRQLQPELPPPGAASACCGQPWRRAHRPGQEPPACHRRRLQGHPVVRESAAGAPNRFPEHRPVRKTSS
jgi:hypothetical protein